MTDNKRISGVLGLVIEAANVEGVNGLVERPHALTQTANFGFERRTYTTDRVRDAKLQPSSFTT